MSRLRMSFAGELRGLGAVAYAAGGVVRELGVFGQGLGQDHLGHAAALLGPTEGAAPLGGKSQKSPGGIMGDSAYYIYIYIYIYIYLSCCIDKGKCLSESCII